VWTVNVGCFLAIGCGPRSRAGGQAPLGVPKAPGGAAGLLFDLAPLQILPIELLSDFADATLFADRLNFDLLDQVILDQQGEFTFGHVRTLRLYVHRVKSQDLSCPDAPIKDSSMPKKKKVFVKQIPLHRWFPPNDPVATAMVRLCILREDIYLELRGFALDSIEALDDNGVTWRRLYFVRQAFRTIVEAKSALMFLQKDRAFKLALKNEDPALRQSIQRFERDVARAKIKDVRDAVAAHLLHGEVQKLVDRMDDSDYGLTILGSTQEDTHFKFAADLVWSIILNDVPKDQHRSRAEELGAGLLSNLLGAVDAVLSAYAISRRLV
jgi:hypothetical protein